jgi:hypothetical protein
MTSNDERRPRSGVRDDETPADDGDPVGEREADLLVQLVGRLALDRGGDSHPASERFFEWWRQELRARSTAAERAALHDRAAAFATRLTARLALGRISVRKLSGAPRTRPAAVAGSLAAVLAAATAERCAPMLDLEVAAGTGRELWDEAPISWSELPEGMPAGGYVVLAVAGESMEPLLHAGDRILLRLEQEIARDAIVVARHPDDGYVVKRVEAVSGRKVWLSSLNPDFPPLQVPRRSDCILGTVVLRWCDHGD